MKKGNKGLLIGIGILVLVAIVGIALFFAFANQKTEIYVTSFDKQVTFSIGKYSVDSFQCSSRDGNSITKAKDAQTILNNVVANSDCLYQEKQVSYGSFTATNYIFLYKGYYFVMWVDSAGQLVMENVSAEFSAATTEYLFSFPATGVAPVEDEMNFYSWEDIGVSSFEELTAFYSNLADGYCKINEAEHTIRLNCCDANNFREITTTYPITIQASTEGVTLSFESEGVVDD